MLAGVYPTDNQDPQILFSGAAWPVGPSLCNGKRLVQGFALVCVEPDVVSVSPFSSLSRGSPALKD